MFNGIIIVPAIIANAFDVSNEQIAYLTFASIMVTSVTTWIQAVRLGRVGAGYVLFMGTSGTFFACTLDAIEVGGLALVATMCLLSAPVEFLFSYFLRHVRKIVTPAVGGVVIMLVTVMVVPIGLDMWTGSKGKPGFGTSENLIVGLCTFLPILLVAVFGGNNIRLWAPIIGTAIGYAAGGMVGLVDFAAFRSSAWIGLPIAEWPGIQFQVTAEAIPILITFAFATLVGTIESVGDAMAVQRVSERNFKKVDYDRVQGCLYADGVGNCLAGMAGTIPNTTYSGNIAILELTGVASRQVGIYGAVILAVLAFCPKMGALMVSIPGPVLGASLVFLMGMLFATGVQLTMSAGMNYQTSVIVGVPFCVGLIMQTGQFFVDLFPKTFEPVLSNGLVMGGLTAVLLSWAFQIVPKQRSRLQIEPHLDQVSTLNDFIEQQIPSWSLTPSQAHALQLACEEVFVHMCRHPVDEKSSNVVNIQIIREEDHLHIDMEDRSLSSDVDLIKDIPHPETATESELDQLGLLLLNRVAKDVTHIRISGYNCISFKIY